MVPSALTMTPAPLADSAPLAVERLVLMRTRDGWMAWYATVPSGGAAASALAWSSMPFLTVASMSCWVTGGVGFGRVRAYQPTVPISATATTATTHTRAGTARARRQPATNGRTTRSVALRARDGSALGSTPGSGGAIRRATS